MIDGDRNRETEQRRDPTCFGCSRDLPIGWERGCVAGADFRAIIVKARGSAHPRCSGAFGDTRNTVSLQTRVSFCTTVA